MLCILFLAPVITLGKGPVSGPVAVEQIYLSFTVVLVVVLIIIMAVVIRRFRKTTLVVMWLLEKLSKNN